MATASEIIDDAFREPNLVASGTTVTTALRTEALGKLNRIIRGILGNEVGEALAEWPVSPPQRSAPIQARYPFAPGGTDLTATQWPYPPANVRLMSSVAALTTVYLQEKPAPGARVGAVNVGASGNLTLSGNGRMISGNTTVTFASDDDPREWFYRDDLGQWIEIETLTDSDEIPFPVEFDDYFISRIAIEMAPRFGKSAAPETVEIRTKALARLTARYRQPTRTLGNAAEAPNSFQTYGGTCGWMT